MKYMLCIDEKSSDKVESRKEKDLRTFFVSKRYPSFGHHPKPARAQGVFGQSSQV